MTAAADETSMSIVRRLWIYQAERFPLIQMAPILGVFSAASISVSAHLAGRPLPGWTAFATAFAVTLMLFFQMRCCDEVKDAEDDRRYRPERAVPRGLVSLQLVIGLGVVGFFATLLISAVYDRSLFWPIALVQAWLALMTVEFFAPDWLRARPFVYLVSHMAIMPLVDLFVTAVEWLPAAGSPPSGVWLFLALSFANGCVMEIGRKLWAPENEREGVETYSALLGVEVSAAVWFLCACASFGLLVGVGIATDALVTTAVIAVIALSAVLIVVVLYASDPTPERQKLIETASGLWVFVCYATAGFAPYLAEALA